MRRAWVEAEELGVDCVFNWDHFFPLRGEPEGKHFEALTVLGAMAEVTERVELGSLVICNAYRNPEYLADAHRTIDHISGGRAILGIGAGWFEKDYDEYGYDFGTRGTRLDRARGGAAADRVADRQAQPAAASATMPILIGGGGVKRTLKLVARHGDIWHAFGSLEVFREKKAILDEHCADEGRDPAEIERSWAVGEWATTRTSSARPASGTSSWASPGSDSGYDLGPLRELVAVARRTVNVDESTEFGAARRTTRATEIVVWMTTVTPSGAPLPMPVWFLWEGGESVVVFSRESRACATSRRTRTCRSTSRATGAAAGSSCCPGAPRSTATARAHQVGAYIEKYADHIERLSHTPESFGGPARCRSGSR